jgi:hypothetical protein
MDSSGSTANVPAITTPVMKAERRKNFDKFVSRFMASSAPYTTMAIPAQSTNTVYQDNVYPKRLANKAFITRALYVHKTY